VVADASPLSSLGRIGRLDLLHAIFGELLVPGAVWTEIVNFGVDKPGAKEVDAAGWINFRTVQDRGLVALLRHDLGAGRRGSCILRKCNTQEPLADTILCQCQ